MTNRRQDSLDVQLAPADLSIYDPKIHPENVIYLALGFRHEASQNTGTMAGATKTMSRPWSIPRPRLFEQTKIIQVLGTENAAQAWVSGNLTTRIQINGLLLPTNSPVYLRGKRTVLEDRCET